MQLNGYCYLCGAELGKRAIRTHIRNYHVQEGATSCALIKVDSGDYWLYVAAPLDSTLKDMDQFLRAIWLECCGHLSEFTLIDKSSRAGRYRRRMEVSKSTCWKDIPLNTPLTHEYDFGSTTECEVTVLEHISLPVQHVDLLARNVPIQFTCCKCGKPATQIWLERLYDDEDPFFCDDCLEDEDDMVLPVVNSPRMGVCGYCGELDPFDFRPPVRELPKKITRGKKKAALSPENPA